MVKLRRSLAVDIDDFVSFHAYYSRFVVLILIIVPDRN